jgi:predicted DNA helicase
VLQGIKFKTVLIDEASQALEAECWNAILKADKVILAGDPMQLPPTVKSEEAKQLGMSITLLDRMRGVLAHVSLLTIQYRMNDKILGFPNQQFYDNQLQSALNVAQHILPEDASPLSFIDTAGCGFEEVFHPDSRSLSNPGECQILLDHLTKHMGLYSGVSIGIISPYAEQVRWIKQRLAEQKQLALLDIEVNTIDGFQGQEKEVIYISFVRSNDKAEIGFLKDQRRLNVAMTRAQKKLVMVGDSATISSHSVFGDLIQYVEQNGQYASAWEYLSV